MTLQELREKTRSLPLAPGVYLMQDKSGTIIYVGKAKKLKNRVSQYFQDTASHSLKTKIMVSQVDHFDVIVASSEFEALVLECSLIKRHMPKYNILLKDDKGYPYLRLDPREEFPTIRMVNKVVDDGASYYGPYGGRSTTQKLLDAIRLTLKLPGCSKKFPRDQGKDRPCLNYQMGNCAGWCRLCMTGEAYRAVMRQAQLLLAGKFQQVTAQLREEMEHEAENLRFEQAAALRDQLKAVESLAQKQLVTAGSIADTDVIGYHQTAAKACFAVLHFAGGNLIDKDYEIVELSDSTEEAVSTLVKQYYLARQAAPKNIFLPCDMEDAALFAQMLFQQLHKHVHIRVPQRGENVQLVALANTNAKEEAERATTKQEHISGTLVLLGQMLALPEPPSRIEAYDISNLAGTDIVASMTVFVNGQPLKRDYRKFKLEGMEEQDDYGSMRQVLHRRFAHFLAGDAGFDETPSLLLIDGGVVHAGVVRDELAAMGITQIPIYGMVKDNRHRTRALVTPDGAEIGIASVPAVFALIGRIQEETHRFAITYNRALRSGRLKASELDEIPGIGAKRKQDLIRHFKSLTAIREAELPALELVLPRAAARSVYHYYHKENQI